MFIEKRSFILIFILIASALFGAATNIDLFLRISISILIVACIIRGIQEKNVINPYFLFALTPFSLLIYRNISNYHLNLTTSVWVLALINMSAFIIALEVTPDYKKTYNCVGAGEGNVLRNNTILLLLLSMLPWVFQTLTGRLMPLASVFSLFISAAIICALKSKSPYLIVLVVIACLIMSIRHVTKSTVLTYVFAVLIGIEKYYIKSKKQKHVLVILALIAAAVMIASFSFANQGRSDFTTSQDVYDYYSRYGSLQWSGNNVLIMPYMYLTTPWANLQYVLNTQNTRTYGLWLIRPLLGYLQLDGLFSNYYEIHAYSNFNTFTYIAYNFKDFGFCGSIITSLFLGWFVKKIYSRYKQSYSPLDTACYVLAGQAVAEMFFSNEFLTQSFPFTIFFIMGIYKYIFCRGCNVEIDDREESLGWSE